MKRAMLGVLVIMGGTTVALGEPITIDGFSGNEINLDFSSYAAGVYFPGFWEQPTTAPVTWSDVVFSEHGTGTGQAGLSLGHGGGQFGNIPGASMGYCLSSFHAHSLLRLDFLDEVRRVGVLGATAYQRTFTMTAYDASLSLLGSASAAMPAGYNAVFVGLEFPTLIARVEISCAGNGHEVNYQHLRFESIPEPAALSLVSLGGLALIRSRRRKQR